MKTTRRTARTPLATLADLGWTVIESRPLGGDRVRITVSNGAQTITDSGAYETVIADLARYAAA
jgi:hypothetical protein